MYPRKRSFLRALWPRPCCFSLRISYSVLCVQSSRREAQHRRQDANAGDQMWREDDATAVLAIAHQLLLDAQQMLAQFHIVVFDVACATVMARLRQQHRRRKRYADLMIAAMVIAGQHILVTRNRTDFVDVLPVIQLAN